MRRCLRHTWQLRGVNHVDETWGSVVFDQHTEALYVCLECGKAKTRKLTGIWTKDALRGSKP